MAVDEIMIDEEFYTVLTNRQTGRIALLAETLQVADLRRLVTQMGDAAGKGKEIAMILSATYENFSAQCFPKATVIADKFHLVKHIAEAVQVFRLRLKQEELSKIPSTKKERRGCEEATRLINGESRIEMLTRSRYLLFKKEENRTVPQQKRASLFCFCQSSYLILQNELLIVLVGKRR